MRSVVEYLATLVDQTNTGPEVIARISWLHSNSKPVTDGWPALFPEIIIANMGEIPHAVKKRLVGGYQISYSCPRCSTPLNSPLYEAGTPQGCPTCGQKFVVPGKHQADEIRAKQQTDARDKEAARAANQRAKKERRLANQRAKDERNAANQRATEEAKAASQLAKEERNAAKDQAAVEAAKSRAAEVRQRELQQQQQPLPTVATTKPCLYCGETIQAAAQKCRFCGESQSPQQKIVIRQVTRPELWNPAVAALLSLILPGVGQMYKGQPFNGIFWFFTVIIGYLFCFLPGLFLHLCCIIGAASGDPTRR